MTNNNRFYYNIELEYALRKLFGDKYYQFAGSGSSPSEVKKATKKWVNKIEKRIEELTNYDLRLNETSNIVLEQLKEDINQIEKKNNDWIIIARLLELISLLVGYDFLDGNIYRHVIFFQDKVQENTIGMKKREITANDREHLFFNKLKFRKKIVKRLKNEGHSIFEISGIMNISQNNVKKLLLDRI